ncbi:hypothetical protein [Sorangium sp. So ce590]
MERFRGLDLFVRRGRVVLCRGDSGANTLPSGVDLVGSFDCMND